MGEQTKATHAQRQNDIPESDWLQQQKGEQSQSIGTQHNATAEIKMIKT